jgi:hypothetical protein
MILAYFGPGLQLPLTSIVMALSGIVMMASRMPLRFISKWRRALGKR